ncbi:MAG: beta-ketoacyl synthase N-terminal-like domain-containing protein, partial [Paenisporosarcina sp.]|nr:beta-ketoacyl synthase N-terminal-like domain-containing protein [Paenisporosarcina sp.]
MTKRRVVITGIGAVTPLGNNIESTWAGIKEGRSGIGPLTRVNPDDFPAKVAAEVKDFDIE